MSAKRCQRPLKTECIGIQWRVAPETCGISSVAEVGGTGTREARTKSSAFSSPGNATLKTRVGFLVGALELGGAERWLISLLKYCDRSRIEWTGVGLVNESRVDPAILAEVQQYAPVLIGDSIAERVVARSHVVIAQFVENLAAFTKGFHGRSILVSHMTGDWNAQMILAAARGASEFVAVSKAAATSFPLGRPVTVLYNGVDEHRIRATRSRDVVRREWNLEPHQIAVGFLGRLAPEKNPHLIAEAVAQLAGHYRAVFVGGGPFRDIVNSDILRALPNAVIRAPVSQIGDVLTAIDCFVLPSSAEGFSLGLAEAWLAGVPTVASPVGAVSELEERHGPLTIRISSEPTTADVASGILNALSPEHTKIIKNARSTIAAHYTARTMSDNWTRYLVTLHSASPSHERLTGPAAEAVPKRRRVASPWLADDPSEMRPSKPLIRLNAPRRAPHSKSAVNHHEQSRNDSGSGDQGGDALVSKETVKVAAGPMWPAGTEASFLNMLPTLDSLSGDSRRTVRRTADSRYRYANTIGMPRVGMVVPALWVGGIERWMMGLVRHVNHVHWSGCACLWDGDVHPDVVREVTQLMKVYCDQRVSSHSAFSGMPYYCLPTARDAVNELARNSDVLLVSGTGSLRAFLSDEFDGRVVLISHGADGKWTREVIATSADVCTDFVAVSQIALTPFRDLACRATVIDNGIELARCQTTMPRVEMRRDLGFTPEDVVVGFLGRLADDKRPEYVAKTVAHLRSERGGDRYKALYVGDGYLGPMYRQQARELLGDAVRLHDPVSNIGDMLTAMDCFLLPSPWEGSGFATLEAWACGVPTVTCDTGIVNVANGEHGLGAIALPQDASPEHFAIAVKRALRVEHQSVVAMAKALVYEHYTAEHMGRKWSTYLNHLWT